MNHYDDSNINALYALYAIECEKKLNYCGYSIRGQRGKGQTNVISKRSSRIFLLDKYVRQSGTFLSYFRWELCQWYLAIAIMLPYFVSDRGLRSISLSAPFHIKKNVWRRKCFVHSLQVVCNLVLEHIAKVN